MSTTLRCDCENMSDLRKKFTNKSKMVSEDLLRKINSIINNDLAGNVLAAPYLEEAAGKIKQELTRKIISTFDDLADRYVAKFCENSLKSCDTLSSTLTPIEVQLSQLPPSSASSSPPSIEPPLSNEDSEHINEFLFSEIECADLDSAELFQYLEHQIETESCSTTTTTTSITAHSASSSSSSTRCQTTDGQKNNNKLRDKTPVNNIERVVTNESQIKDKIQDLIDEENDVVRTNNVRTFSQSHFGADYVTVKDNNRLDESDQWIREARIRYYCPAWQCPESFLNETDLKRHKKTIHFDYVFPNTSEEHNATMYNQILKSRKAVNGKKRGLNCGLSDESSKSVKKWAENANYLRNGNDNNHNHDHNNENKKADFDSKIKARKISSSTATSSSSSQPASKSGPSGRKSVLIYYSPTLSRTIPNQVNQLSSKEPTIGKPNRFTPTLTHNNLPTLASSSSSSLSSSSSIDNQQSNKAKLTHQMPLSPPRPAPENEEELEIEIINIDDDGTDASGNVFSLPNASKPTICAPSSFCDAANINTYIAKRSERCATNGIIAQKVNTEQDPLSNHNNNNNNNRIFQRNRKRSVHLGHNK